MRGPLITALAAALALAGCKRHEPEPGRAASEAPSEPPATAVPATFAPTGAALDRNAIHERRSPERVVRFYAAALAQGQWDLAATAWRATSGVTGETLKASYDRGAPLTLEVGKGEAQGAAGSIYYEVPVTLRFGGGKPEQGTLTLRRVNGVPGANAEQLDWRIERSTIGASQ
jgi:hypothetical protein